MGAVIGRPHLGRLLCRLGDGRARHRQHCVQHPGGRNCGGHPHRVLTFIVSLHGGRRHRAGGVCRLRPLYLHRLQGRGKKACDIGIMSIITEALTDLIYTGGIMIDTDRRQEPAPPSPPSKTWTCASPTPARAGRGQRHAVRGQDRRPTSATCSPSRALSTISSPSSRPKTSNPPA